MSKKHSKKRKARRERVRLEQYSSKMDSIRRKANFNKGMKIVKEAQKQRMKAGLWLTTSCACLEFTIGRIGAILLTTTSMVSFSRRVTVASVRNFKHDLLLPVSGNSQKQRLATIKDDQVLTTPVILWYAWHVDYTRAVGGVLSYSFLFFFHIPSASNIVLNLRVL